MNREEMAARGFDVRRWESEQRDENPYPWGDGPWRDEPDRVEWRNPGSALPRLVLRNRLGAWCGYVGLPPWHPLHGRTAWGTGGTDEQEDDRINRLEVHWGITYANECRGGICHVPAPGEPAHVWWLGFDCAHSGDLAPGLAATVQSVCGRSSVDRHETYRDLDYVVAHTEALAAQLEVVE